MFEDDVAMSAAGFTVCHPDPLNLPTADDSSELSKQTRIAGVAFASQCAIIAASNFMRASNADLFNRSLGDTVRNGLSQSDLPFSFADVTRYLRLLRPGTVKRVLNPQEPGEDDFLRLIMEEIARSCCDGAIAFSRTGSLGFDVVAVPLATQTVNAINAASRQFGW